MRSLLRRYQMRVAPVFMLDSTRSGKPSPLKSATPATFQPEGRSGPWFPVVKILLCRYQITVARLLGLSSRKSGNPSLLKSVAIGVSVGVTVGVTEGLGVAVG